MSDTDQIKMTVDLRIGQNNDAQLRQALALMKSQASIVIGVNVTEGSDELFITVEGYNLPPERKEMGDLLSGISEAILKGDVVLEVGVEEDTDA